MMRSFGTILLGVAMLGLSACGGGGQKEATATEEPTAAQPSGPSLASAPAAFGQCVSCHSIKPGQNGIGPSLFGVVGRKAGTGAEYFYTDAMKNSGITWDRANLDQWLTAPQTKVPGTKMAYAGQPDPAKRQAIIDFLATLK
jgi:cytochrome c